MPITFEQNLGTNSTKTSNTSLAVNFTGAASRVAALHSFELAQVGTRDEPWAILIKRNTGGTSGSGGTSPTPQPTAVGTSAAGTTAMVKNPETPTNPTLPSQETREPVRTLRGRRS